MKDRLLSVARRAACALVVAVPVAAQTPTLAPFAVHEPQHLPSSDIAAERFTDHCLAVDLNGDGALDLVAGAAWNGSVSRLLLNDGDGRFRRSPHPWPLAIEMHAVAAADVDGDGDEDLVHAWHHVRHLLVNDGTGRLSARTLPDAPGNVLAIRFSDVDGDGDVDVFSAADAADVLLNDGSGVFTVGWNDVSRFSFASAGGVAVADFDRDGDDDLVAALGTSWRDGELRLYSNDGTGSFSMSYVERRSGIEFRSVETTDVDGDGADDLVLATRPGRRDRHARGVEIWLGDGAGGFENATGRTVRDLDVAAGVVLPADLDGDGDPDLIVGTSESPSRGTVLNTPVLDVVLENVGGRFRVVDEPIAWPRATDTTTGVVADFDRDGDLDCLLGGVGRDELLFAIGPLRFASGTHGPRGWYAPRSGQDTDGVLVDVDGDEDLDLVVVSASGQLDRVFRGDGAGRFVEVDGAIPPASRPHVYRAAVAADLDRDGDADLVLAGSGYNGVFFGNGDGTFTDESWRLGGTPEDSRDVAVGDVNGDGLPDLLFANSTLLSTRRGENDLFLNVPGGTFFPAHQNLPQFLNPTEEVELVDVDGDGDLDVFFGSGNGLDVLALNDGRGNFVDVSATHLPPSSMNSSSARFADLDGDGDLDLVTASIQLFAIVPPRVAYNDGAGRYTTGILTTPGGRFMTGLRTFDHDRDGDVDILFENGGQRPILVVNDGPGSLRATYAVATEQPGFMVDAGDVDGDGDIDLVGATGDVWLNRRAHVAVPTLPRLGGSFELELFNVTGTGAGSATTFVVAIGLAPADPVLRLPPFGTWRVDPNASALLPPIVVPGDASTTVTRPLPAIPSLLDARVWVQPILVDSSGTGTIRFGGLERTTLR